MKRLAGHGTLLPGDNAEIGMELSKRSRRSLDILAVIAACCVFGYVYLVPWEPGAGLPPPAGSERLGFAVLAGAGVLFALLILAGLTKLALKIIPGPGGGPD